MYSFLLAIIYIAFISLGLPDSLIGSAWPVMHGELGVPLAYAGIVTMIISGGTIVSSLLSDRLTSRFGAGFVTAISVLTTAAALFGFSISHSFILLCVWAIPYGLGAGAVDAALNNFVALHYTSRHMNWLHCFWGVGAAISPYIMSFSLTHQLGWNNGYRSVSIIQLVLTFVLFLSLPAWKRKERTQRQETDAAPRKPQRFADLLKIKGLPMVLLTFFAYCALEQTTGLWASSYLVRARGIDTTTAAKFASLFFLGITFGRFLSGLISDKLGDKRLIRLGSGVLLIGVMMIVLPAFNGLALIGLIVAGIGSGPIYPSIIHATPENFGKEKSQGIIGVQMASAYVGTTFMPPIFGWLSSVFSIKLYPLFLLLFAVVMILASERMNQMVAENNYTAALSQEEN